MVKNYQLNKCAFIVLKNGYFYGLHVKISPKKRCMNKGIKIFLPAIFILVSGFMTRDTGFPTPTGIKNMLFYVQRSLNKNTIVYQLNVKENEEIDTKEPIKMYWVNYAGKGDVELLNFIQRKYAYGLDVKIIDKEKKSFCFNFVSYKPQTLYLIKSVSDKKYHVFSYFGNKLVIINRIYIHIEGGTFWYPKVKYIEVMGKDPLKNEEIIEKIIP